MFSKLEKPEIYYIHLSENKNSQICLFLTTYDKHPMSSSRQTLRFHKRGKLTIVELSLTNDCSRMLLTQTSSLYNHRGSCLSVPSSPSTPVSSLVLCSTVQMIECANMYALQFIRYLILILSLS